MPSFYDLLKYAKTGIASSDMTAYDKMRALAMAGGAKYPVQTITGVPPLPFLADGRPLSAWSIDGNGVDGCGDKTKNFLPLPSSNTLYGITFTVDTSAGTVTASGENQYEGSIAFNLRVPADVYGDFYLSGCPSGGGASTYNVIAYDRTNGARCKKWDGTTASENDNGHGNVEVKIVQGHTTDIQVRIATDYDPNNIVFRPMLRTPTASADFEPYGYKIQLTCGGETKTFYIKQPLRKSLDGTAVDMADSTGTLIRRVDSDGSVLSEPVTETFTAPEIPTVRGSNTLTIGTTVQPSSVTIMGHIKPV